MLAVAGLAAAALAAAPGPAAPPFAAASGGGVGDCVQDDAWPVARQDFADQVVALVNAHRATLGLVPLKVSPTLSAAAVWKARHMSNYRYLAHDDPAPPVDRSWFQRILACGYPSVGAGENIALGYETPEAVMNGWLTSPGHLANIENPSFRAIGVGVARATSQDGYLFWVQDFGATDDSTSAPPPPPPPPPVDATAPTAPGLVTATASSATQVAVTWGPSTDDVGVTGYRVYRDGAEIAATSALGYADQALASETTYSYTVRAYDAAGNLGPASNAASVTTPALPPPPPPPPPPSAAPTVYAGSYAIESGSAAAGSGFAAAVRTQDGSTFDVAAAVSGNASWYARFNVQRGVTGLSVAYAGASTQPCARTLSVWDWAAYAWLPLDTGTATTSTDVVAAVVPGPPARFLGGSSILGVVRVRLTCSRADAAAFTLQTDRLTLSAG